ncbi:MAG: hypothetical protein WAU88_03980 [Candidatus Zixiibacteriota bacterium]
MIFGLIRLIIWMAGVLVIAYFALPYFGYQFNWEYFQDNRTKCEIALKECQEKIVRKGLDGAKEECNFRCAEYTNLIQKITTNEKP